MILASAINSDRTRGDYLTTEAALDAKTPSCVAMVLLQDLRRTIQGCRQRRELLFGPITIARFYCLGHSRSDNCCISCVLPRGIHRMMNPTPLRQSPSNNYRAVTFPSPAIYPPRHC